jgi:hypothetical protein
MPAGRIAAAVVRRPRAARAGDDVDFFFAAFFAVFLAARMDVAPLNGVEDRGIASTDMPRQGRDPSIKPQRLQSF